MGLPIYSARRVQLQSAMSNVEMMMLQIAQAREDIVTQVNELTIQRQNLANSGSNSIWTDMASMASMFSDDPNAQSEIAKFATIGQMMESMNGNSTDNQAQAIDNYIAQLKAMEQQYELRQKALETTYSQMSAEYEQVKEAELKAASKNAPNYG